MDTAESEERALCRNCGKKMAKKGKFCPHCGQKNIDGLEPFGKLLTRFWKSATHLDNKFVKMCWQLFVPARVTLAWAQGKMRQYPHPVQFFFVVMFFFLFVLSKVVNELQLSSTRNAGEVMVGVETAKPYKGREIGVFEALQRYIQERELRTAFDSMVEDTKARVALDSALRRTNGPVAGILKDLIEAEQVTDSMGMGAGHLLDTLPFSFINRRINVATKDIVNLSPENLIEKYHIEHWIDRVLIKQGIKSIVDPVGIIRRYVGGLAWTILAHIALMSFFMSALYWFQKRYYVEHFVFLLHRHSGNFLLCVLLILTIGWGLGQPALAWFLWLLYLIFSLPPALKRYYQQSWGWTLFKWFWIEMVGLMTFALIFAGSIILAFLIF